MSASQTLALQESRLDVHGTEPSVVERRRVRSLRTERKLVTVVFIDVNDSMGLTRAIELEDWWSVAAGLFELVCDGLDHFGGWLGSFTGDGVNAVFEPDARSEHHAERACLAALWVRDALRRFAAEVRNAHGLELSVRIGINSGEVLTGTIGRRHRRVYTASGYAVALAKRMETLARPRHIYLTEYTAARVTSEFRLRDLGEVMVKGAGAPIGVFELIGTGASSD